MQISLENINNISSSSELMADDSVSNLNSKDTLEIFSDIVNINASLANCVQISNFSTLVKTDSHSCRLRKWYNGDSREKLVSQKHGIRFQDNTIKHTIMFLKM